MKIYQIVEDYKNKMHAGSKATNDAVAILSHMGAEKIPVLVTNANDGLYAKLKRQFNYFFSWRKIYKMIEPNSALVIQNPFRFRQVGRTGVLNQLRQNKNITVVALVHDVELLRYSDSHKAKQEFEELVKVADKLIVHNTKMKNWFMEQGVADNRLVELEIFDYLSNKSSEVATDFSRNITVAGNLGISKSPYVYQLGEVSGVNFDLMGVNYEPKEDLTNVSYKGAFAPEDVPNHLTSGFGLIWDGPSVESCQGITGDYLRYNNPHKLSLYISSSLPVVIWSQAAEADFVEKHGLGITVDSLHELEDKLLSVSEADYQEMVINTKVIKEKLQSGYYLTSAMQKALNLSK